MDDLILIGKISSTHGLSGSLKIKSSFASLEDLVSKNIILKKLNDIKICKIKEIKNFDGSRAFLNLEEIDSIEKAKEIQGYDMYVHINLLENYEEEISLIDYFVYDRGKHIGVVKDIMETAAHEILVIDGEKEILIPFIDVFVKEIDDDNKRIYVELIEGFL